MNLFQFMGSAFLKSKYRFTLMYYKTTQGQWKIIKKYVDN